MDEIPLRHEPGDVTVGLAALCDMVDADALLVRRWSVHLLDTDGERAVAASDAFPEEDLREFLERLPEVWVITGGAVSVQRQDGRANVYVTGTCIDDLEDDR